MEEVDLSRVPQILLTSVVKLAELNMSNTGLTPQQIMPLWTAIKDNCNFKSFSMAGTNLASVDHGTLVRVTRGAYKLGLSNTSLTAEQVTALVSALDQNQQIQEIDLSDNSLAGVDPELLARVFSRTRRLNLVNTGLTAVQVTQLLKALTSAGCHMENLDLSANLLSMIEPDLMAESVNKLKAVTLFDTGLSVNQVL